MGYNEVRWLVNRPVGQTTNDVKQPLTLGFM